MREHELGEMEMKFAKIIWENEPVSSGELVKLCETLLEWKKSTTYTMLRRLCQRGIFQNSDGCVTSLMSEQDLRAAQSEHFIDEAFGGSLPAFVAAFSKRNKLSDKEIDELQKLIDENRKER